MLDKIPTDEELKDLIGGNRLNVWHELCDLINNYYDVDHLWNSGGKAWKYEYKYRRGGKTLCALYARENCFGFMMIFGKVEREKFEADRQSYSDSVKKVYDDATTYHDGKWMMFDMTDDSIFEDLMKLLTIKRKPNR